MEAYFDNSATTRCSAAAAELMMKVLREDFGNPETGELNEMEAWLAAIRLAERMDETNKKSKDVAES